MHVMGRMWQLMLAGHSLEMMRRCRWRNRILFGTGWFASDAFVIFILTLRWIVAVLMGSMMIVMVLVLLRRLLFRITQFRQWQGMGMDILIDSIAIDSYAIADFSIFRI